MSEGADRTDAKVEAAIARVLACERDAREAIEHARREATDLAEAGRAAARAVGERTEARIRAVRALFERRLTAELAALRAAEDAIVDDEPIAGEDLARLDRAIAALAVELTGGAP
jgi:hypothetical protein